MSEKRKLNAIIPLVVYPFDVMISFGETDEELAENLKQVGIDITVDGDRWKFTTTKDGYAVLLEDWQTLIRLQVFPENCKHYGILAHEIFHAVTLILENVGIPFQLHVSDEAYAYLIEYLTKEILSAIK